MSTTPTWLKFWGFPEAPKERDGVAEVPATTANTKLVQEELAKLDQQEKQASEKKP
jgi:hypothetical protein